MKFRRRLDSSSKESSELELLLSSMSNSRLPEETKREELGKPKCLWLLVWSVPAIVILLFSIWMFQCWDIDLPLSTKIWAQVVNYGWQDVRAEVNSSKIVDMNLVIAGLAKDTAPSLPRLLLHIEDLICSFERVFVVVFEDGSEDNTRDVLNRWREREEYDGFCARRAQQTTSVMILSKPTLFRNLEKIVWLRNEQLNVIKDLRNLIELRLNSSIRSLQHRETRLVVLDFDLHAFDVPALIDVISSTDNGNRVVCANGITNAGKYRDWFATISEDGAWAFQKQSHSVQIEFVNQLNEQKQMRVRSCFGGLAVYNLNTLFQLGCRYRTTTEFLESDNGSKFLHYEGSPPDRICEHSGLHRCLWSHQVSLYIQSDLRAFYGCSKSSSSILRKLWPSFVY